MSKSDFDAAKDRVLVRKMRIFQAIVTEKFPKLQGRSFEAKVQEYETKWQSDTIFFSDSKKLHDFFGIGIQIWVKKPLSDRHYGSRKIFDTKYKSKVRVIIDADADEEKLSTDTFIEYVFDETALHYYSCPNKHCFFGTDQHIRFLTHQNYCRTETRVKYSQKRYEKSGSEIRQALVDEKILPTIDFQNTMFGSYDIGKIFFVYL